MPKTKTMYILIVLALIFLSGGIAFWQYKKNYDKPKRMRDILILSYGHFEPNLPLKVAFDYPNFSGWETRILPNKIQYIPGPHTELKLDEIKTMEISQVVFDLGTEWQKNAQKNKNGEYYTEREDDNSGLSVITFVPVGVEISYPRKAEYYNFSGEIIRSTIIDSFRQVID